MEHLDHQDWKNIIVRTKHNKGLSPDEKKTKVVKNKGSEKNKVDIKLEKKVDEGDMKHKIISLKLRQEIQKRRTSQNLTQKDLATRINLPVIIISEIESGKAIYNHHHMNKIKRFLKIPKEIV
tara:strand:- start:103 stop:471 length:369 start_codon:yes stop_codon:yes gene_type:complete